MCVIHAQLLLCIALRHEYRRGADLSQYRQVDQRARKCVIASAFLSFWQNDPYTPVTPAHHMLGSMSGTNAPILTDPPAIVVTLQVSGLQR